MSSRRRDYEAGAVRHMGQNFDEYLAAAGEFAQQWEGSWGLFEPHSTLELDPADFEKAWSVFTDRLRDNFPFFHPRYAGQMLKPPHPAAAIAYIATLFINPNNHALDGGPATARMEKEAVAEIAGMLGLEPPFLGHLTSSGTIANLEALWVGRELRSNSVVAVSTDAHYTHERMGRLLGVETVAIPVDGQGRLELSALESELKRGKVGTVVVTAGTTGTGSVDPVHEIAVLKEQFGFRLHVDAAYGGFFALLANDASIDGAPFAAITQADSVAIDPHKHGLQPYGCGCVLFSDPGVGQLYSHYSPYTYFTSDELHLGEISLECSRAGAAAAALWFTIQCFPLRPDGRFADALRASRRAALSWTEMIRDSDQLRIALEPDLDIVCFFPSQSGSRISEIDLWSQQLFERLMYDEADPIFLSVFRTDALNLASRYPDLVVDQGSCRILRSVLMKPEHETAVVHIHKRVETQAGALMANHGKVQ